MSVIKFSLVDVQFAENAFFLEGNKLFVCKSC